MTVIESVHADHGATFEERGDRRVVAHYGRPERTHAAVRNVVGVTERGYGVLTVEGDDRVAFVDNAVSNRVPDEDGEGCYALLLDPQGAIETDMYVYNAAAGDRLLVFLPPTEHERVAEDWRSKTFIQDVEITDASDDFGVFGVYGPQATEKIASVLNKAASPDRTLSFVRGTMADAGVTVIRDDGLAGEEGYEVVCAASEAADVFDTLENRGNAAAPFGYRTWETLTLEAGTPLFETELSGRIPNVCGVRNALDFEKGCYVGQEVVSRVENRGRPSRRFVGLVVGADVEDGAADAGSAVPGAGAAVFAGDAAVGEVTRGAVSPTRDEPVALAAVDSGETAVGDSLAVRVDGEERPATRVALPFVEGSDDSARRPRYPDADAA
ncbi:aminomethyltransferase family protein [Halosimplex pelagicum]|uniref:Aminomethyl transferase family protein n=1 Tax=Halosimplex pelagicum TaxID=869886 RepID=A0A7D5TEJ9_9EURY|nr:aminomethyltransferase family protein [Halosimplex pelagicum]QLH84749.1 aminomethyl transferase family protein [Halosimplex pelagicum]